MTSTISKFVITEERAAELTVQLMRTEILLRDREPSISPEKTLERHRMVAGYLVSIGKEYDLDALDKAIADYHRDGGVEQLVALDEPGQRWVNIVCHTDEEFNFGKYAFDLDML